MEPNQIHFFGLFPSSASPIFSSSTSNIPVVFPHAHSSNAALTEDKCGTSYGSENKLKSARKDSGDKETKKRKIAFQTRSQVDVLDDGFRWRKYGQKTVKNSKFPRLVSSCYHQDDCTFFMCRTNGSKSVKSRRSKLQPIYLIQGRLKHIRLKPV